MAGPTVVGEMGFYGTGGSTIGLGGPPYTNTIPVPLMPVQSLPYVAHCFTNAGVFKSSFSVLNRPAFTMTLNGGFNQITLEVPGVKPTTSVNLGDWVRLSQQGGDGTIVYSGIVEDLPDTISSTATVHQILLTPLNSELSDRFFSAVYAIPTDVAQIVRDALSQTNHLSWNWVTIPNTGVLLPAAGLDVVTFTQSTVQDVLNTALLMAGPTYSFFSDAIGQVYFQPTGSSADYTITLNQYQDRVRNSSIKELRNYILVIGGVPAGNSVPTTGLYSNTTSQTNYGVRTMDPPPYFPVVTDTTTLQNMANSLGGIFDHSKNTVTFTLNNFPQRIVPGQIGAATARYWEPNVYPLPESEAGTGAYIGPYIVLSVEVDAPVQKLTIGDFPYNLTDDWSWLFERLLQRQAAQILVIPAPTLSGSTVMSQGTGAGISGGLLQIVDKNNIVRVALGSLPPYGDPSGVFSPPEYGIRLLDPLGNIIFDPAGVVGPITELGANGQGPGQTVSATSYTPTTPAITFNFTLNRQVQCQFFGGVSCHIQTGAGLNYNRIAIYDSGSNLIAFTGDAKINSPNPTLTSSSFSLWTGVGSVVAIGPGTYTARIETKVDSGTTAYFDTGVIYGQRLGA
jgi:hypothetical protein